MARRIYAAEAFAKGDAVPLATIIATVSPATFFDPQGESVREAEDVRTRYERDAAVFQSGITHFEILHLAVSDTLAYWVGFQVGVATVKDKGEVNFKLRVTEVFRKDENEWKLIHRHADSLST